MKDLREIAMKAGNVRGRGLIPGDLLEAYLEWTERAERKLANELPHSEIAELIFTRRYWALRNLGRGAARLLPLVDAEIQRRQEQLTEAADELENVMHQWRRDEALLVVPDTNVLVEQEEAIDELDWWEIASWSGDVRVVVPLLVVDELDGLKRGGQRIRGRAAFSIARLSTLLAQDSESRVVLAGTEEAEVTLEVLVDPPGHERMTDPDYEIIDRASHVSQLSGRPVRVVTGDLGMQLRAITQGLETIYLPQPDR